MADHRNSCIISALHAPKLSIWPRSASRDGMRDRCSITSVLKTALFKKKQHTIDKCRRIIYNGRM